MSLHEGIVTDIAALIDGQGGVDIITPASIANVLHARYRGRRKLAPQIEYTSLEHLKQLARRSLSGRYDTESDETEAYQGELFSGHLQRRYPIPRKRGDEPTYKLLEALSDGELRWNVHSLDSSADARTRHARALEAYRSSKADVA